jgi:primosomal protein N' (replication factor Y)
MRGAVKRDGKTPLLSDELAAAIEETHARGEQSIILLNRRGFSQFVICRSCGESIRCQNCDITLTHHKRDGQLVCHYCNYRLRVPTACPHCESKFIYFMGDGTERVEDELTARFPAMRIERVDRDSTSRKRELENVLERFAAGETDMLVGTQMLAKGHDFHNVTLVGVISADAGLAIPDFRSAERTFQLLTQVAGRAGRGELPGRVLIQTYFPEHYALRHARQQDYDGFFNEEIEFRRKLLYPPFVVLACLTIKHQNYEYAMMNAQTLKESLIRQNKENQCRILGVAPAPLARLRNEFRLHVFVKAVSRRRLRETIELAMHDASLRGCDVKIISVEIDPLNLL